MTVLHDVARIQEYICGLANFHVQARKEPLYNHIGATICDTILQAGMNYRTVVAPRINRLLARWPSANIASKFLHCLSRHGLNDVLLWKHSEKPTRIGQFTEYLLKNNIETESELSAWLTNDANCQQLKLLRGIGPKSVDYLKMLLGLPAIAVDRHVKAFVALAGVHMTKYEDIQEVVSKAADVMQFNRSEFDFAIWSFMSSRAHRTA